MPCPGNSFYSPLPVHLHSCSSNPFCFHWLVNLKKEKSWSTHGGKEWPNKNNIMYLRFNYVVLCNSTSFLYINEWYFIIWINFCLSIFLLVDIRVVARFWLLWIRFLWTFCVSLSCEHMFLFSLGKYLAWNCWVEGQVHIKCYKTLAAAFLLQCNMILIPQFF